LVSNILLNILLLAYSIEGKGTHYSPGNMEATVQYRVRHHQMVQSYKVMGYVALPNCDTIGDIVLISFDGEDPHYFQQADCSQGVDWKKHTANGSRAWAEADAKSAKKLGFYGRGKLVEVKIYGKDPWKYIQRGGKK
jgi:hypothetical protein